MPGQGTARLSWPGGLQATPALPDGAGVPPPRSLLPTRPADSAPFAGVVLSQGFMPVIRAVPIGSA